MTKQTITIVLTTYNGEEFLKKQLDSYLNQTIGPDELLVGDDGSTDKTIEIVNDFARRSPFSVRLIQNKERMGYGDNFLNIAAQATTNLVAFSDQDDIWHPEKIEISKRVFFDPDIVLCAHAATQIDEHDNEIGSFNQGIKMNKIYSSGELRPWGVYAGFTMVVRKSLLDLVPWKSRGSAGHTTGLSRAHDRWVYFLADSFGSTAVISKSLALYRQHQNNQFGSGQSDNLSLIWQPMSEILKRSEIYSEISNHRAALLMKACISEQDITLKSRAMASARRWDDISNNIKKRELIYKEQSRTKRFSVWLGNMNSRVYSSTQLNAASVRAAVKDFLSIFK